MFACAALVLVAGLGASAASAAAAVLAGADVGITAQAGDLAVTEGATFSWTVTAANAGPDVARVLVIRDSLPAGITRVSGVPSRGSYDVATHSWAIDSLGVGESATLTLTNTAGAGTAGITARCNAAISAALIPDPMAANDSSSVAIRMFEQRLRVVSGTYVGNGIAARAITGVGFQPDLLIIKSASASVGVMRTRVMTGDASKELGAATALVTGRISSLDFDGFTVGTNGSVNRSGTTYYWTAMLEVPGQLQVGTYTGNGSDNRSITGIGFTPTYGIVGSAVTRNAMQRYGAEPIDAALNFSGGNEVTDRNSAFRGGWVPGGHECRRQRGRHGVLLCGMARDVRCRDERRLHR
jgi:uncharacterized repeat protein (TIGR01451 family)